MDSEILKGVLDRSDGVLILVFILLIAAFVPLYTMLLKGRKQNTEYEKQKSEQALNREKLILDVVTANTKALTSVTEVNSDFKQSLSRIHDRIDAQAMNSARIETKLDNILLNKNNKCDCEKENVK